MEWAYIFDEAHQTLYVLERNYRSETGEERHMVGMFGCGIQGQYWSDVLTVDLAETLSAQLAKIISIYRYDKKATPSGILQRLQIQPVSAQEVAGPIPAKRHLRGT